jgi:hypothetical protein
VLVLTSSGSAASRPMTCMRARAEGVVVEKARTPRVGARRRRYCESIIFGFGVKLMELGNIKVGWVMVVEMR